MKVGTDGVLLGAWANAENPQSILDIGTGTGLIALMCAQRFPEAKVTGIEISDLAFLDAQTNFNNSPFQNRLSAINKDVLNFTTTHKYDLITCNPPFFAKSLKSSDTHRNLARHQDSLPVEQLLTKASDLMSIHGGFAMIVPIDVAEQAESLSNNLGLYLTRKTLVRGNENAMPKRALLQFEKSPKQLEEEHLVIESARHQYTPEYIKLTKSFYLKM